VRDYIIRRLLWVIPIMVGVSFLTFALFRIIPGDAVIIRLNFGATEESVNELREAEGLNRNWFVQYLDWLFGIDPDKEPNGVVQGDLGHSLTEGRAEVRTELARRLPVTLELMFMTVILAILLGIPPGIISAIRPNTPVDWFARVVSVLWLSIPGFYLGILIIAAGSIWFNWTPPQFGQGYVPFTEDPWTNIQEFFLPSLVLAVGIAAVIMRLTRSAMLEVLRNDYIRTAWSKGLRERTVVWRHALKNALIPVVTLIGLQIGALIGGAVIIESLFALNGIGKYALEAIIRRDVFVVQSLTLLFAVVYVVCNLMVDIAYAWLDPRIHYT
jgi:peptide/nickel transport system permease protein